MIDQTHPLSVTRKLRRLLRGDFPGTGRCRIGSLMHHAVSATVCLQLDTSRRHRAHPVFLCLLPHRPITRQNELWAMDITYIPMARGFVDLAAVLDWAVGRVLSSRVSISLGSAYCIAAGICRSFTHNDSRRPHSSLTDRTPDDASFCPLPLQAAA